MKSCMMVMALALAFLGQSLIAVQPVELTQMNGQGGIYKMADHPQGIFVVEAYFLNCPYCNYNAPNVNALADKFANDPRVQVLDVGVDRDDASYKTWIKKHNPNHPVLKDSSRKLISQLGTSGYPSTYVINCKGQLVEKTEGEWGAAEEEAIVSAVERLQAQNCNAAE
ncbi:MAG: TlpA family protein disulfide reductase [Deltaproteobacteria bacterium]|nr:TlpA family protein disulfide reductase [Deltaproteobacteria bacterium]